MKIAIHKKEGDFSSKWISYCQKNKIDYKIVNCYKNSIVDQLVDCDALMWHFSHSNPKDVLFAKQLLFSLQSAGKKVFPNFHTSWHFDDKVGQKYLLEAIGAPLVPSYVFYNKKKALEWIEATTFPKVFKLRKGAGSAHVKLISNRSRAKKIVSKAFSSGFSQYDKFTNLKDRWYKFNSGKADFWEVVKGIMRIFKTTNFAKVAGNEIGYVYFQDYLPNNDCDFRIVVINDKAFAIKREVREGDFRASGSGIKDFDRNSFNDEIISIAFEVADRLKMQSVAFDFLYDGMTPKIVEISYGFMTHIYPGFWDKNLNWHEGSYDVAELMVETILPKQLKHEH